MRNLLDLPPEVVVWVFESLDNIDDALHLARCCRYLHSVFDPTNVRLRVFRSIILYASQHERDLELNQATNMYTGFASEFYGAPTIPANPDRRRWYTTVQDPLEKGNIPAETVWDTVCRWHGLRILFDFYLDKAVSGAFVESKFSYTSGVDSLHTTEFLASEDKLPHLSRTSSSRAHTATPERRNLAYQRFYRALVTQWLSIESLWKVRSQVWPNAQQFDHAFTSTLNAWTNNPKRPLQEKVDIVEIVDFVWGFLARKAFHVSSVPSWLEGEADHVIDQYIDDNESEIENWGFFVRSVLQFLRPPQIIALVLSSWYPSEWNFDRPGFLRQLGLFDTWEGVFMDEEDLPTSDNWVPLDIVDDDVENSLRHMTSVVTIEKQWQRFRNDVWPWEIKGKVFFRETAVQDILVGVTGGGASKGLESCLRIAESP